MKIASRINQSIKILSLTAALGLGFTLPAFALDGDAFFARVQSEMKTNGYNVEASNIAVDGDNVKIADATISPINTQDVKAIVVKNWVFDKIEEDKIGGYLVGHVAVEEAKVEMTASAQGMATIKGIETTNLLVKSEAHKDEYKGKLPYDTISVKKISVDENGAPAVVLDDFSFGFSEYDPEKSIKMAGEVGNLHMVVSSIKDAAAKENLTKMGFEQLDFQGNYTLNANLEDGHVDLGLHGNMNDAAQLDIAVGLDGLTKDLAHELVRISEQANSASPKDQQIAGVAMLGLIQQLNLKSIDIKFDDNSITNKVIDLQKGADVKREDFVAQLKMILPLGLGQLQHPEFAANVSDQLGKYLDNPENLEVTAKPENGAPFAVIAATAMTSPKALIDLLKVDVKANQ